MSTEQTSSPEGAPSFEQAIEILAPEEAQAEAVEAPQDEDEAPASETETEATQEADEDPSEADEANAEGDDEAEQDEPETPAIDPPPFWDADAKAAFAGLTPEQQSKISAAAERQAKEASQRIQKAVEQQKAAESQAGEVTNLQAALADLVPKATEALNKWANVDWAAWAEQDPTAAFRGKLQYEAEMADLQRLNAAKEQADQLALRKFTSEELAKLPEVAPDLADPAKGQERRTKLAKYLVAQGVSPDQLPLISASEMSIAWKACLYDEMKVAKPPPQKTATQKTASQARPSAKPTATPAGSPASRSATSVANRFAQTRSTEDAIALLLAQGR